MILVAKEDLSYPPYDYNNWVSGKEYPCHIEGKEVIIEDERGVNLHFIGDATTYLKEKFLFLESDEDENS